MPIATGSRTPLCFPSRDQPPKGIPSGEALRLCYGLLATLYTRYGDRGKSMAVTKQPSTSRGHKACS